MKKTLTLGLALALTSSVAMAEGLGITTTVGAERALDAEKNSVFGSVSIANITAGATFANQADDTFGLDKVELDVSHKIGEVTLYVNNDFNSDFKHSETVIGAKISF